MSGEDGAREPSSGLGCLTSLFVGAMLFILGIPVAGMAGISTGAPPRTGVRAAAIARTPVGASYLWPVEGTITSEFGWRIAPDTGESESHTGLDIGAEAGLPVRAAAVGVVIFAGWSGNYGNLVKLRHYTSTGTVETWYGHLSQIKVTIGQTVSAGQAIGLVGSTGRSTGPHVHFEYRVGGKAVDPHRLFQ